MVGRLYLEQLSDADLGLLADAADPIRPARPGPERIEALIDSPTVFRTLFGTAGPQPPLPGPPFPPFSALVPRVARAPGAARFVAAGGGPATRGPLFSMRGPR